MSKLTKPFVALLVVLSLCVSAFAQSGTSRVTGTIQDRTGAVIPGAKVTLTNQGTKVAFTTTSSSTGNYTFDGVQSGTYSLTAEAGNFKKFVSTDNAVTVGQPVTLNASLDVGAAGETVEVSGATEQVQTSTSGNIGNLVDQVTIENLPIVGSRGRNPLTFLNFQPGVVSTLGESAGGGVHVHGSRDRAWNFTLDGVDINETSTGGSNFAPIRTNPDSVAEFRVITANPTAEYGRNSGGQVTMVTKSGTNKFHGTGFWFYQTPALNANEYANKVATPVLPRPQFVQNIYGGSVGGPIIKDKTFFFTNIQLLHTSRTRLVSTPVYTASARAGTFRFVNNTCTFSPNCRNNPAGVTNASVDASGNVVAGIPISTYNVATSDPAALGLDPTITALLGQTPLPNDFTAGDGLNIARFTWQAGEEERQVDEVVKIDHVFNQNHSIFGRWSSGHQNTIGDFANSGWALFPGSPNVVDTIRRPRNLAINYRWNLSPRMTNELILGLNRFGFDFINPDPNSSSNPPFVTSATSRSDAASLNSGISLPNTNYSGNGRFLTTFQLADNFSMTSGAHSFKWGANLRYGRHIDRRGSIGSQNASLAVDFSTAVNSSFTGFNVPTQTGTTGTCTTAPCINSNDRTTVLNGINNLLGRVGNISRGFVANFAADQYLPAGTFLHTDFRIPEYDFFFQDSWKLRPNIVLDLGLRWDLRLTARTNNGSNLRPNQPFTFGSPASTTLKWERGDLYRSDWNNVGPSIGIAWDPTGSGKNSIRANYRLAYDRMNTFALSGGIFQGLPGFAAQVTNTAFGQAGGRLRTGLPTIAPSAAPSALLQPPSSGASFSATLSQTVIDPDWQTPKTHQWGLSFQREVLKNTVLELNYVGNHGGSLFGGYNVNQADIFKNGFLDAFKIVKSGGSSPLINQLLANDSRRVTVASAACPTPPVDGSAWLRSGSGCGNPYITEFGLNSVAAIAALISQRVQGGTPLTVLAGLPQTFFMPYPQYGGALNVLDSGDWSNYHALEVQLSRRYSEGLTYQVSYTFAKSMDTRSFDPTITRVSTGSAQGASSTPFNVNDRGLNYARSDFDRRHSVQGSLVYELPFGKGHRFGHTLNGFVDRIIGGWQVSSILALTSGRPFTVYSGSNTVSNVQQSPANCTGCSPGMGSVFFDPAAGNPYLFDSSEIAKFSTPGPGELGDTGRNYFDLPHLFNADLAIGKKTRVTEGQTFEVRLEMTNAFNNVVFGVPNSAVITSSTFARERAGAINASRKMQLAMKYSF
ncbi:MAG TPA: carboxypeptidase regulatory-like domain-containing protein [Terriglobales bacterium]|nr:carboxypeptidase regulatory-like domain-containing protein [Terriglobales bacterium]